MWAFGIGLSIAAALPFFFISKPVPGASRLKLHMPETHDMFLHYDQMTDFYRGLEAGRAYPRWEEDTNYGFGAPTMCFYPPGVYYLTSALYPLFRDWMRVLLATHLLMMLASAAAIYWCARQVMSRWAAAVAMSVYVLAPYHLVDQYQRGAMAELLSFIWAPLMLGFAERLLSAQSAGAPEDRPPSNSWRDMAGFALSYAGFLWSHPPTAYQLTLALAASLPFLALLGHGWRGIFGLIRIGVAGAVGLGLSAAYLYPAAMEQDFIRHEIVALMWPYSSTYIFLHPGYTRQYPQFFILLDRAWILSVAAMVLCGAAILVYGRRSGLTSRLRTAVASWLILGGFVSFMMIRASAAVGRHIPEIEIGVFSWRMLSLSALAAALLTGTVTEMARQTRLAWPKRDMRRLAVPVAVVVLVLGSSLLLSLVGVVDPVAAWPAFTREEQHVNYAIIPRTAPANTDDLPDMQRAEFHADSGRWTADLWKPEERVLRLSAPAADLLTVRTFNYPGWVATLDGRRAAIGTDPESGAMTFEIPAGEHRLTLEFTNTPPRHAGDWISIVAILVLLAMLAAGFLQRKQGQSL